ncbi:MAG: hypothetical protein HYX34_11525 [Actinobacteria bacterium]|nr:hypothetical protein [Actinomycetota bacterium]
MHPAIKRALIYLGLGPDEPTAPGSREHLDVGAGPPATRPTAWQRVMIYLGLGPDEPTAPGSREHLDVGAGPPATRPTAWQRVMIYLGLGPDEPTAPEGGRAARRSWPAATHRDDEGD